MRLSAFSSGSFLLFILILLTSYPCYGKTYHTSRTELTRRELAAIENASSTHKEEMFNAVRRELCPISDSCTGLHHIILSNPTKNNAFVYFGLLCRTEDQLIVEWYVNDDLKSENLIYLIKILKPRFSVKKKKKENPLTLINFNVVRNNHVTFNNLSNGFQYFICLYTFNSSALLKKNCGEFWTLPLNFVPQPIPNIQLEGITYNNNHGFEALINWKPAEDFTCFYDIVVWENDDFFMEIEKILPKHKRNATLYDLKYSTNYTLKITGKSNYTNKESENTWFSFVTSFCIDYHDSLDLCPPPMPTNITVAEEFSNAIPSLQDNTLYYNIHVKWKTPILRPDFYTVNLTNTETRLFTATKNISGNESEVLFEAIDIGTSYQVSIIAISKGGISEPAFLYREIKHKFDNHFNGNLLWAVLAPIFLFIIIISSVAFIYHRHEKFKLYKRRCQYFEGLEKDAPREIESGSTITVHPYDDLFEIIPENITLYETLGEGAFGVVRRGWLPDQKLEIAVKMLKDEPSAEEVRQFKQEIDMMKAVGSHTHIVSLVGCCTKPTSTMMLIVEFCSCGDLQNYLRFAWDVMTSKSSKNPQQNPQSVASSIEKNGIKYAELASSVNYDNTSPVNAQGTNFIVNKLYDLEENINEKNICTYGDLTSVDLLSFARQIAMGMEFLSSNRVVHRDLAARNVLVCADKTVKIADFGLSRDIYQENMYKKTGSGKLPIKWMALESLTHQVYTTQSDVWSYGVLLWEIVTLGGSPYPGVPSSRLLKYLTSGCRMECPSNCSQELYGLMVACWQSRPKDRPTFSEIKQKIDTLLDNMCSNTYLTLDILNYKELHEMKNSAMDQFSRNTTNSMRSNTENCSGSERYMQPIIINKNNFETNLLGGHSPEDKEMKINRVSNATQEPVQNADDDINIGLVKNQIISPLLGEPSCNAKSLVKPKNDKSKNNNYPHMYSNGKNFEKP